MQRSKALSSRDSARSHSTERRAQRTLAVLAGVLLLSVALAIFIGRYPKPYWMPFERLQSDGLAQALVLNLRLPRILAAVLLGMALGAAGTVMQMLFRNPLVEPGFLGVTQGAAFGAALSLIVVGTSVMWLQMSAIGFALLGLAFSYLLADRLPFGSWVLRLVLAGIVVSALFAAGLGLLKHLADPLSQLPAIVFWLLGGLYSITWGQMSYVAPVVIIVLIGLYAMRWRLNLLSLDDDTVHSLGINAGRERVLLLILSVAAVAVLTAVSGIIAWVGLIVPHMARQLVGADAQWALPASLLVGGSFALWCDTVARAMTTGEIPLGILTSLLGATVFTLLMLLRRTPVSA